MKIVDFRTNLTHKQMNKVPYKNQKVEKKVLQSTNENFRGLSTPTSLSSGKMAIEQPHIQKPVKLIHHDYKENIVPENDQKPVQKVINVEKSSNSFPVQAIQNFKSQEFHPVLGHIEIEYGKATDLDFMFEIEYGHESDDYIFLNLPDFSQAYDKSLIKPELRTKMIDWMIEVFAHYSKTSCEKTFFIAVGIMDLFVKKTTKRFKDGDLHLIGMVSMFIASKTEDIYHIPLKDMVEGVGHFKFSAEEIKAKEWEILKTLDFFVTFPTYLDCLDRLIYKNFQEDNLDIVKSIKNVTIYIIKMCLHNVQKLNYHPLSLTLGALSYCIKCYFFSLMEEHSNNPELCLKLAQQETFLVDYYPLLQQFQLQKMVGELENYVDIPLMEQAVLDCKDMTQNFEKKYPEAKNLLKYADIKFQF